MMAGSLQAHEQSGHKKPRWTEEEVQKLLSYMKGRDRVRWPDVPKAAGLNRDWKSCWSKWRNYLRPGIKRGNFSQDEVNVIIYYHSIYGNKWALMARELDPRTDNEIKNYYNTHLRKKLSKKDIPSSSQTPLHEIGPISTDPAEDLPSQTRGLNYEAMENPTVYNNYAADPGLGFLYGNATNEGSTPALMVSREDVFTPPPEVYFSNNAWMDEFYPEDQTVCYNYAADPGLGFSYGNATNEGSTPEPMVSVENWPSPLWVPWPEDLPSQTRSFNSEAMENPTVYNNYAADPGPGSLYWNATNEGSTPALMVSVENVLTQPPEEFSMEAWIEELRSG